MEISAGPLEWVNGEEACLGKNSELFFSKDENEIREAMMICMSCVQREPCLDYALGIKVEGIWGGTTDQMRSRIRKQRNLIARRILD